jgi:ribonuclease D
MTVKTPAAPPLPAELDTLLRRLRMPYVRKAAPEVIATARDIDAVATQAVDGRPLADVAVARGWRRQLVGETLLAIARGELAVRYDPKRRAVVGDAVPAPGDGRG